MCWDYSSAVRHHLQILELDGNNMKTATVLFAFSLLLLVSFSTKISAAASSSFNQKKQQQQQQEKHHTSTIATAKNNNMETALSKEGLSSSSDDVVDIREVMITLPDHDNIDGDIQSKLVVGIPKKITFKTKVQQQQRQQKPILIFLHGSFHSSWCYKEHFLPYFVSLGYPVISYSWRGTYDTPLPTGTTSSSNAKKKVKIRTHCHDLHELLQQLPTIVGTNVWESSGKKPILICHSFAGLYVMKYLEQEYFNNNKGSGDGNGFDSLLGGIICLCCIPPSGMKSLTTRCLVTRPLSNTWKIIKGLAMKQCFYDVSLCRELFFDTTTSDEDIQRYQTYFQRDGLVTIDLSDLKKELPSLKCNKVTGRAPFVNNNDNNDFSSPVLVIGAKHDFIVDLQANIETCNYFGVSSDDELVIVDSPHDIMLGKAWKETATIINDWISSNVVSTKTTTTS